MGQGLETLRKSRIRIVGKKSSPENLVKFLNALAKVPCIKDACLAAGFSTTAVKYYMQKARDGAPGFVIKWGDREGPFDELVQQAFDEGNGSVQSTMFKRALGYLEPQVHQGRVQYEIDYDMIALGAEPGSWDAILKDKNGNPVPVTVMRQSEDLLMFLAKAHMPELYGAKAQLDVTLKGGVMVITGPVKTSADLEALEKKMREEIVDIPFVEIEPEPESETNE